LGVVIGHVPTALVGNLHRLLAMGDDLSLGPIRRSDDGRRADVLLPHVRSVLRLLRQPARRRAARGWLAGTASPRTSSPPPLLPLVEPGPHALAEAAEVAVHGAKLGAQFLVGDHAQGAVPNGLAEHDGPRRQGE